MFHNITLARCAGIASVGAIALSALALTAPAEAKIPHIELKVAGETDGVQKIRFRRRGFRRHGFRHFRRHGFRRRGFRRFRRHGFRRRHFRRFHRFHHRRWHRRHWRHWRRRHNYVRWHSGYAPCRWVRRRAFRTGSPYWWHRYRRCLRRFY